MPMLIIFDFISGNLLDGEIKIVFLYLVNS